MKSDIDGQEVREIAILVVATFKKEKGVGLEVENKNMYDVTVVWSYQS